MNTRTQNHCQPADRRMSALPGANPLKATHAAIDAATNAVPCPAGSRPKYSSLPFPKPG